MSRHGADRDGITVAQLTGTATRHAHDQQNPEIDFDEQPAIAVLVALATEHHGGAGPHLRVDLIADAAGSLLGGYRHDPSAHSAGEQAARLLILAGGDALETALVEEYAARTRARLAGSSRGGIGNPT